MGRTDSERRGNILEGAVGVFGRKGFEGATVREIGREAGVNSALLYYYFEDKRSLYLEAVLMVLEGFFDRLASSRGPLPDAEARIRLLVENLFEYYGEKPHRARFMAHTVVDHAELLGEALNTLVRTRALIPIEVLQEGVARGDLRPCHPVHVWWSILGMSFFSIQIRDILSRINPDGLPFEPPDIAERRDQVVDLLLRGLAAPQEQAAPRKENAR